MSDKVVDEKVVKVTLDINDFKKKGDEAKKSFKGIFDGIKDAFSKKKDNGITSGLKSITNSVKSSVEQSKKTLSSLKDSFKNLFGKGVDTSGVSKSVKKMNTELNNSVNQSGTILGRLRSIFSKTSINGDGFKQVTTNANNMVSGLSRASSGVGNAISSMVRSFSNITGIRFGSKLTDEVMSVQGAINKVDASPIASSFQNAASSVSGSINIMDTALGVLTGNLITKGVEAAMQFGKQFTQGMREGFQEYELNMRSIQTILANTKSAGTTLDDVKASLAELNEYADQTIYSFADMTNAIGGMTTAGVPLEVATNSVKGFANAAAHAGASSTDMSRALIQVNQALGKGHFALIDWKSLENAKIATRTLKEELVSMGKEMGTITGDMEVNADNFNETLTDFQWLTTDVWNAVMNKYTDVNTELGAMATDAATKIRTFSQLIDTTKESIQSGWGQTWQYIIGDFEQATHYMSEIGQLVGNMVSMWANGRNAIFKQWNEGGGYEAMWNGILNIVRAFEGVFKSFNNAAKEVFGTDNFIATALIAISRGFERLTQAIAPGTDGFQWLTNVLKILFSIIKVGVDIVGVFLKVAIIPLKVAFGAVAIAGKIFFKVIETLAGVVSKVLEPIRMLTTVFNYFANSVIDKAYNSVVNFVKGAWDTFINSLEKIFGPLNKVGEAFKSLFGIFSSKGIVTVITYLAKVVGTVLTYGFLGLATVIMGPVLTAFAGIKMAIQPIINMLTLLSRKSGELAEIFVGNLKKVFETFKIKDQFKNIKNQLDDFMTALKKKDWKTAGEQITAIGKSFGVLKDSIKNAIKVNFDFFKQTDAWKSVRSAIEPGLKAWSSMVDQVSNKFNSFRSKFIGPFINSIRDAYNLAFKPVIDNMIGDFRKFAESKGIDTDKLFNFGKTFNQKLNNDLFNTNVNLTTLRLNFQRLKSVIEEGRFDAIPNILKTMGSSLLNYSKDIYNAFTKSIHDIFKDNIIYKKLLEFKNKISNVFKGFSLGDSLSNFKKELEEAYRLRGSEGVIQFWKDFGKKILEYIKWPFQQIRDYLKGFDLSKEFNFEKLANNVKVLASEFSKLFGFLKVGNVQQAQKVWEGLNKTFENSPIQRVLAGIIGVGLAAWVWKVFQAFSRWSGLIASTRDFVDSLTELTEAAGEAPKTLKSMTGAFRAFKMVMAIGTILAIAHAVKELADAIKVLGEMNAQDMIRGVKAMSIVIAELAVISYAMSFVSVNMSSVLVLISLARSVAMIGKTVEQLGNMNGDVLTKGMTSVSIIMGVMAYTIRMMNDVGNGAKKAQKHTMTIIALAIAVRMIGKSVEKLGMLDEDILGQGTASVSAIMGAIGVSIKLMNMGKGVKINNFGNIIGLAAATYMIGESIIKLGNLNNDTIVKGGIVAASIMGALSVCVKLMGIGGFANKKFGMVFNSNSGGGTLLALAGSVYIVGLAVEQIGKINKSSLDKAVGAVTIIIGVLSLATGLTKIGGPGSIRNVLTLITFTAAVHTLSMSMSLIGMMPVDNLIKASLAVTAIIGGLATATKFLNGVRVNFGALGALIGFSAGVLLLIPSVLILGTLPEQILTKGIIMVGVLLGGLAAVSKYASGASAKSALQIVAIAASLVVLSQVMIVLGTLSWESIAKGLTAMGGALAIFVSAAAIAGLPLVSTGLMALSVSVLALGAAVGVAAAGIGIGANGIANAINAFISLVDTLKGVSENEMISIVDNVETFIIRLSEKSGSIAKAGADIILNFIKGILEKRGELFKMGWEVLMDFLKGIRDNIGETTTIGIEIIVKFIEAMIQKMPELVDKVVQALLVFFKSVVQSLSTHAPNLGEDIKLFLKSAVDSAIDGLAYIIVGIWDKIIKPIVDDLVSTLERLKNIITDILGGIQSILHEFVLFVEGIFNGVIGVLNAFAGVINSVFGGISGVIDSASGFFRTLGDIINETFRNIDTIINSVGTNITKILDELGNTAKECGEAFKTGMEGISTVIQSLDGMISTVFKGIAEVIESFGNSAEKAGRGAEALGRGIKMIVDTRFSDLAASLGQVADKLGKIANDGTNLNLAANALIKMATSFTALTVAVSGLPTPLTTLAAQFALLNTSMTTLPTSLELIKNSFNGMSPVIMSTTNAFIMLSPVLLTLGVGIGTLVTSMTFASTAFGVFGGAVTISANAITMFSGSISLVNPSLSMLNSTLSLVTSALSNVSSQLPGLSSGFVGLSGSVATAMAAIVASVTISMNGSVSALRSGLNNMSSSMSQTANNIRSHTNNFVSIISQAATRMSQEGRRGGQEFSRNMNSGISSGAGAISNSVRSIINNAVNIVNSGRGAMSAAGGSLTAGVAAGMWGQMWQVERAANAIIAKAEAAARAAARINSPSKLFRDSIGISIPEGVAVGMEKGAHFVVSAAQDMIDTTVTAAENSGNVISSIIEDALNVDSSPYMPEIIPMVDTSQFDDFLKRNDSITIGADINPNSYSINPDRYNQNEGSTSSTTNNTSEYNITVNVEGTTTDPNDLADMITRKIKRKLDIERMSKGEFAY